MLLFTMRILNSLSVASLNTFREPFPLPKDLYVFLAVVRKQSFANAAKELGQSPAYVSKRIQILERTLKVRLLHRTGRCITLTSDGELVRLRAMQILGDLDVLLDDLSEARRTPRGLLQICGSFGFGRNHLAPAIAQLADCYPELEIRLEVFDRVVDIAAEGFDLEIRVGDDIPGQHVCRRLVPNKRVLCASPEYLARHSTPDNLEDLKHHQCLVINERNNAFGVWNLERSGKVHSVRVSGPLSSNHGEIVLQWALHGRGILLRSMWDVGPMLAEGSLVRVLNDYSQSANVWAVYATRLANSAKLRVSVEFLERHFNQLSI